MAIWKQVTDFDDSIVVVNMDNITHIRQAKGEQTTMVFFVSGAGNEVYVTVKETPEEILTRQPLRSF
jgi:hypothetical protein